MSKNIKGKIEKIKKEAERAVSETESMDALEDVRVRFLGRKSELNLILKGIKDLSPEEKKEIGPLANITRKEIEEKIESKKDDLEKSDLAEKEWIDVTMPGKISGKKEKIGHLNLLSKTQRKIEEIFNSMGFEIADGPEIDTEWYNFTALNVPANHPARDMQDTFWIKQQLEKGDEEERILPRTQTSNNQVRFMQENDPPLRIVVPGRVFRNENTDACHEHTFYQFEALVVGKEISVANFKDIARKFFTEFFETELKVRLRPGYFPFVEPGFEFDISCTVCGGEGCKSCKHTGWLEIGGAGMVNQKVFENAGYKKNEWQGFAWGFGIERLAMMKHKIDDIRLFKNGDLRFVQQF